MPPPLLNASVRRLRGRTTHCSTMVFATARQAASSKPPLRPANVSNGSTKPVARPTKESHGSKASVHPTKSPAKATAAGQPPIRRHASRTTLPHSAPRTSVPRPSRLQPVSSDHRSSPAAQPRPASPAKRSLSPPSSQSPSGTRNLAHTATLEPVCSGRAHTIGVDKAMIVNFKSVVNWDSRYLQLGNGLLVAETLKPAAMLALPCLTCVATASSQPRSPAALPAHRAAHCTSAPGACRVRV